MRNYEAQNCTKVLLHLELFLDITLDITFLIDPSQNVLLKDHIDINYVVPTEMVKSKMGEKETVQRTEDSGSDVIQIPE